MKNSLFLILVVCVGSVVFSQQQVINHTVPFATTNQNMWGPNNNQFSIDQEISIFNVPWNTSFNTGNSMIGTVAGFSFGAALQGSISGVIGSKISLQGFTTGTLDVDYPIDATITTPANNTYDQGDTVTVTTDYVLDPSAEISSFYPSAGEAKWDLYFQLGASASATVCVFSCATFPIIPAFNTGLVNINLVTVNASGVSMLNGLFTQQFLPYPFPPALEDYGITGFVTIPYVSTTSVINNKDIQACGDSTYFNFNVDVFDMIGAMNIPYVSTFFANLAGSQNFGIAVVSWNFFSTNFDANITNHQCFDFDPTVYVSFNFPVPVSYRIINPITNVASPWQNSSIINIEVGKTLQYKFPCYFETVNITPTYTINGQITNHTYDEVTFDLVMSALGFGFTIPAVQITPAIYVPSVCIPIYYPCGAYWFGINWCSTQACTPAFTIPAIGWGGYTYNIGPLWSTTIPIGSFSYDWFNQTWSLGGFQAYSFSPFSMTANVLSATASATPVSCHGGSDGSVALSFNHVAYPLTYLWTNGSTSPSLSNVSANAYQAQIIDANGCQLLTGATVTQPAYPLQANLQVTDVACFNSPNNGAINATISGGTAPYSYSWNNGATTEDLSNIAGGSYSLTVTDANSCVFVVNATVAVPSGITQTAVSSSVSCFGGNNGALDVSVSGGNSPYSYSWNSGPTTQDLVGLAAGNYTLTVTDANNCTDLQTYSVAQPVSAVSVNGIVTNVGCFGGNTGAIDITPSGGTPGYSFQWSSGNGTIMPQITEDLANLSSGNYSVTAIDANGCTATLTSTISQPAQPLQSAGLITQVSCFGGTNGAVQPGISGGTGPYSYAWSNGSTSPSLTNVSAGNYSLALLDANNCASSFNFTITQPASALTVALIGSNVLCFGASTGAIGSIVNGGTAPYQYLWSNGATSANITNLSSGNYSLTVTDNKGCVSTQSVAVTQPAAPLNVTNQATMVDCFGNLSGSINATIVGGTAPYTSVWINQNSQIYSSSSEDLSGVGIGNYLTIVTDNNGCIDSASSIITQPNPINITHTQIDVVCFGNATGAINATVIGGTLPYNFSWNNGSNSEDINGLATGNYTLIVTDDNACIDSLNVSISQPLAPLTVTTESSAVDCFGEATGSAIANVVGGTAPYQYTWSNGSNNPTITNLSSGVYTVLVTDNNGCSSFSGANINQPQQGMNLAINVTDPTCFGYQNGSIEMTITGGTQPYYFTWGNENYVLLNNPSERLDSIVKGSYLFIVTDDKGCKIDTIVQVNEPTPLDLSLQTTYALCYQSSTGFADLTVTGSTPPYSYSWNNGAYNTEDLLNVPAGNYNVTITDNQGCVDSILGKIDQPDSLSVVPVIVAVSCVDQTDGAISLEVFGGTAPYAYSWSNNESSPNITNLSAGVMQVTITDANNCVANRSFVVDASTLPCVNPVNTFTPNGDLINDTWVIDNMHLYPNASVQVFNKWGNRVYESVGLYTPWDGTYNENPLPAEVYYFIIELNDPSATKLTGTLTVIR